MHHLIMGKSPKGMDIDHINGNTLDNRTSNLRLVPHYLNLHNSKLRVDNKSGHAGVFFMKNINKWWAYIDVKGKRQTLGYYDDLEDAKVVRATAKSKLFV